jgi:trk system potassium uptake protein
MNIIIAGGGRVGFHLAHLLSGGKQDVTVIESDGDRMEQIDYALDVSTVAGDGANAMLLQDIGAGNADLFVAAMGQDESNLIAAATAKGFGAGQAVARVDTPRFMEAGILYETVLGIDYVLSPENLAALEIASYIESPGVVTSEDFGGGLIQMRQIDAERTPTVGGKTLKDVITPGTGVLLGLINRNGATFVPRGDAVVEAGDHVTIIGHHQKIGAVQEMFMSASNRPERVAIMGGSMVGFCLAQGLENRIKTVKLFERREDRSEDLAAKLKKTKVICRDATSRVALEQENIENMDVFVAATGDDERNIMAGVLAKEAGANLVIAIVHQPDFAPLVKRLGIDLAVTPRACFANRILRLLYQDRVTALAVLGEGQIEVAEFDTGGESPVLGKQLKDIQSKFPRDALIATILRGEHVFVPSGEDEIHAGDTVVVIASPNSLETARKLLQKKR